MEKEALLNLIKEAELIPLFDNENTDTQAGWYKTTRERIPALDALLENPVHSITVERRQLAGIYQYNVYCSANLFE